MTTPGSLLVGAGEADSGSASASPLRSVAGRLRRDRAAMVSLAAVVLLLLVALAAPLITGLTGQSPTAFNPDAVEPALGGLPKGRLGGVSAEHWLGVEPVSGRDILARTVWGARVSFVISVAATVLAALLGTGFGLLAGFCGGWVDAVVGRTMDVLLSFPALIFTIALISSLPEVRREVLLVVVLGLFGWPYIGRVVRGQAMSLARREFVEAARGLGASRLRVVVNEILPNLTGPILVVATLAIPAYIATEAGLSFLGVGVRPPTPSWGQMIASAVPWYAVDPMYFLVPGVCLFVTVLAFNVLGDAVRDAVDPRGGA